MASSVLLIFIIAACDAGDASKGVQPKLEVARDVEPKTSKVSAEALNKSAGEKLSPSAKYLNGAIKILLGNTVFIIPEGYAVQRDSGFVINYMWPEQVPSKLIAGMDYKERRFDKISIFFTVGIKKINSKSEKYSTAFEKKLAVFPNSTPVGNIPGMMHHWTNDPEKDFFMLYTFQDKSIKEPDGEPLTFVCASYYAYQFNHPDHREPNCETTIYWPEGISARMRFYRKHLGEAEHIYKEFIKLTQSWTKKITPQQ